VDYVPEEAVWTAAREIVGDAALLPAALHRTIADRSRRYTSERDRLAALPSDPKGDLAARAVFFTLCDAPKIAIPLAELANRNLIPSRPLRIVDVGAGCGALSIGIAAFITDQPLDFTLLDRDADALAIGKRALARIAPDARVTTRGLDLVRDRAALPGADLVVLGSVLNELPAAARLPLIERAVAAIADDGAVIIIEPALRETARALHELRDAVLAARLAHVFAPCTRAIAPCPMLANERDWCHEDRAVTLPPRTAELARVTHLRDDGLKFSYLVLRRDATPLVEQRGWRVVSAVHAPKGKVELDGCIDAGLVQLRLLRRHRTDANRAFERAARGDVLAVDAVEITSETRVERIEPAKR
jgi:ribosomal protein RSM22 (predicted rRNA methylase)